MAGEFLLKKLRILLGLKWINMSPGWAKIWALVCIILFQLGWPKLRPTYKMSIYMIFKHITISATFFTMPIGSRVLKETKILTI